MASARKQITKGLSEGPLSGPRGDVSCWNNLEHAENTYTEQPKNEHVVENYWEYLLGKCAEHTYQIFEIYTLWISQISWQYS